MHSADPNIVVLVMAAGAATRMGRIKQLLPWRDTTLLNHAIAQAKEVSGNVVVVLGAHFEAIEKTLPESVTATINHDWKEGLGGSIAHGVRYAKEKYTVDGILIMLSDQPLIEGDHLMELVNTFKKYKTTVATEYKNGLGVPTIFHASMLNVLLQLAGDGGAKKVLDDKTVKLKKIAAPFKTVDVDTFEDYQKLHRQYGT